MIVMVSSLRFTLTLGKTAFFDIYGSIGDIYGALSGLNSFRFALDYMNVENQTCVEPQTWQLIWKKARDVAVHKRKRKTDCLRQRRVRQRPRAPRFRGS